jgi:hypothetical protein
MEILPTHVANIFFQDDWLFLFCFVVRENYLYTSLQFIYTLHHNFVEDDNSLIYSSSFHLDSVQAKRQSQFQELSHFHVDFLL